MPLTPSYCSLFCTLLVKFHIIFSRMQRVNQHARPSIIQVGCPTCCYQVCALDHANVGTADLDYSSGLCHRNAEMTSVLFCRVISSPHQEYRTDEGDKAATLGAQLGFKRSDSISALTQASERLFQSIMVVTKNDCLYCSVWDRKCLQVELCFFLVLESSLSKMFSDSTDILPRMIWYSRASLMSFLRSFNNSQFRSLSIAVTLDEYL